MTSNIVAAQNSNESPFDSILDLVQAFVQRKLAGIVYRIESCKDGIFCLVETERKRFGVTLTKTTMSYKDGELIEPIQIVLPEGFPYSDKELLSRIHYAAKSAGLFVVEREGYTPSSHRLPTYSDKFPSCNRSFCKPKRTDLNPLSLLRSQP